MRGNAGGTGSAARDVVGNVRGEEFLEPPGDRTGSGELVTCNFSDAQKIPIRRGNENLLGGVNILGTEGLFYELHARFRTDFEQDLPGHAFQTTGRERWREDFPATDAKNICGGALGHFAALVQAQRFVETGFLRLRQRPNIVEPRYDLDARERGRGVASVLAQGKARGFVVLGEAGGIQDEVHRRDFFIALPKTSLIVNRVNAHAALGDFIGAEKVAQVDANLGGIERKGQRNARSVLFQAAPVALICKSFALHDAQRGEDAPAAQQTGLAGRQPDFFNGHDAVVVKNVAMDHASLFFDDSIVADLPAAQKELRASSCFDAVRGNFNFGDSLK